MKKFIVFIIAVFAMAFITTSCDSRKSTMEETVVSQLKSPSSFKMVSFDETAKVTLKDEIEERIAFYNERVSSAKYWVGYYQDEVDYYKRMDRKYGGYGECVKIYEPSLNRNKKDLKGYENILSYLNRLLKTLPQDELNKVTFTECSLHYEAKNSFGVSLGDVCVGRFDANKNLVAYKVQEDSDWELNGDFFSIPNYYKIIDANS